MKWTEVVNPNIHDMKTGGRFLAWPLAIHRGKWSRYAELSRRCITYNPVASLDVVPDCLPRPPAEIRKLKKKQQ
jgi:hypothetical protein